MLGQEKMKFYINIGLMCILLASSFQEDNDW